jgi:hypothetical protein
MWATAYQRRDKKRGHSDQNESHQGKMHMTNVYVVRSKVTTTQAVKPNGHHNPLRLQLYNFNHSEDPNIAVRSLT